MKKRTAVPLLIAATLTATLTAGAAVVPAMAAETNAAGVVVTYEHPNSSTFKAILTDPASIASARAQLAGTEADATHPHGTIVYGAANENTGWTWHLDGTRQVEQSTEVCDGTPQDVESHSITSDFYCPWNARVIALQNA